MNLQIQLREPSIQLRQPQGYIYMKPARYECVNLRYKLQLRDPLASTKHPPSPHRVHINARANTRTLVGIALARASITHLATPRLSAAGAACNLALWCPSTYHLAERRPANISPPSAQAACARSDQH